MTPKYIVTLLLKMSEENRIKGGGKDLNMHKITVN